MSHSDGTIAPEHVRGAGPDNAPHRRPPAPGTTWIEAHSALLVGALVVIGAALRFYRLGHWNLEATEMFTLRDSVTPQWHNTRPLGYLLNYYLVRPFLPLDELGLRVIPAIAGVLAIPVTYAVGRRLFGSRPALLATLLVSVSALLVFYSQFARYWSLVFLFSALYPYALYLGARDRNPTAIAIGLGTMVLAVLAHPVAILAIGGPALWLLATYLRPRHFRQAWTYPAVRWGTGLAAILAVVLAYRLVPMLQGWITMHDRNPGMGQFLLAPKPAHGVKQMVLLAAYLEGLTFPIALAAAAGMYILWRGRDRSVGIFLASLAAFQLGFIALVSVRTPVSTFYLLPAAPAFYFAAGVFLDHLLQVDWRLRPRWLLPLTITLAILVAGLPTLVSQYRNGRRFDFRGVARWLEAQRGTDDIIFSDQPMVLAHYLGGADVHKLRHNPDTLRVSADALRRRGTGGTLWVVAPAPAHAFRTDLKPGGLARWLYDNCQLANTLGRGRLDFRHQYLHVFRCPPAAPPAEAVGAGAGPPDPAG